MSSGDMTIYRSCTPVVDSRYETDGSQTPSEAIIEAVATAADVEPIELPPLYEFIDLDALDTLFQQHEGASDSEAVLSFRIDNWNVFVRADGRLRICDGTKPTEPKPVFATSTP